MYQRNINDELAINLQRLGLVLRALSDGPGSQKRVLTQLMECDSVTQCELTEMLDIKSGSVSEVLAKLERAGLIVRTENERDRRTTDIRLTDEGRQRAQEAVEQRTKRQEEMFSCLTDAQKKDLLRLLQKMNADWDVRYMQGKDPASVCEYDGKGA